MGYTDPKKAAAYAREWRKKHAAKVRSDDRKRREEKRQEDPFYASEKTRQWRIANPGKAQLQIGRQNERVKSRAKVDSDYKETLRGYQAKYLAKPGVRERRNQYTKEWHAARRKENPEHYRASVLKHMYGLTIEQYDAMVTAQDGKCAVCRTDKPGGKGKRWHIDHCHDSDRVRELLCHGCNTGLGAFKDDPERLRAAAAYLEKHRPLTPP